MRMSCIVIALGLAGLGSSPPAFTQVGPAAEHAHLASQPRTTELRLREEDQRIHAALETVLPEVRFENAPLEQIVQWLREVTKANVHVNYEELEGAGVFPDLGITITVRDLPTSRALRLVLDAAGRGVLLGYEVWDGVLFIATQEELDSKLIARMYPVNDLLLATLARWQRLRLPAQAHAPRGVSMAELARATDARYRKQPVGCSMTTTQPTCAASVAEAGWLRAAEDEFLDTLRQSVEPDSWRENGGSGNARLYNGVLVAYQTRTVHRLVERFLADLRAAGCADGRVQVPASEAPASR